jgi:hypothetical protein
MLYPARDRVAAVGQTLRRNDWHRVVNHPEKVPLFEGKSFEQQVEELWGFRQGTPTHITGWVMKPAKGVGS